MESAESQRRRGEPDVRDLYGLVVSEGASRGILFSGSTFTTKAHEFAANKQLDLIDADSLAQLENSYLGSEDSMAG